MMRVTRASGDVRRTGVPEVEEVGFLAGELIAEQPVRDLDEPIPLLADVYVRFAGRRIRMDEPARVLRTNRAQIFEQLISEAAARFDALVHVLVLIELEPAFPGIGVERDLFPRESAVVLRPHHRVVRDEAEPTEWDVGRSAQPAIRLVLRHDRIPNVLLARILGGGRTQDHAQLEGVRVPQAPRDDEPEPWTGHELSVIRGPALAEYEREQNVWNAIVAKDKTNRGLRTPSYVPLRGLCLVAYYTMMRPKNNRALTWEEITLDADPRKCWFKLDQHKNVNKGIKARGGLANELLEYLRSIRPKNARGLIHPNPATGKAYVDIRKQWNRLIEIANRLLGYQLTGKKADFFNFRHTGASHIAARSRDAHHLLGVVRMMGDTRAS